MASSRCPASYRSMVSRSSPIFVDGRFNLVRDVGLRRVVVGQFEELCDLGVNAALGGEVGLQVRRIAVSR